VHEVIVVIKFQSSACFAGSPCWDFHCVFVRYNYEGACVWACVFMFCLFLYLYVPSVCLRFICLFIWV